MVQGRRRDKGVGGFSGVRAGLEWLSGNNVIKKKELHQMRYLFDTELEMFCEKYGFQINKKYKWLTNQTPSFKTWSVVWIVNKK